MSRIIALDFETFYASKKLRYGIKTMHAEQYCQHELFDPYLLSVSDGKTCWAGSPKDFSWSSLEGATLLSHNAAFDRTVYEEMVRRGWAPKINFVAWKCTANMCALLFNRRSLDQAVEHALKIKISKMVRADADGKHWPQDFSESEREAMLKYARDDAFYCWLLFDKFSSQWSETEQKLSDLTIAQGRSGVQVDVKLLDDYIIQTHEALKNTENLIPWIKEADDNSWDEFNTVPTSTKCIAESCRRAGIPCPPVKSRDGEEAFDEWQETYQKDNPWIQALGSWRSLNKLYKTFLVVKERLRPNGEMPFGMRYCGAHTGRTAGESRVNMLNMRKKPVLINESGLMEVQESRIDKALAGDKSWVKHSIDFRNIFIARPGKILIVSDASQIEPRIIAWLAKDKEFLAGVAKGISPYVVHARLTMGWEGGDLKNENPDLYHLAKIRVLQLGYGSGWKKLITSCALQGIELSEEKARKVVEDYRESNQKITGFWRQLDSAFKQSVGGNFTLNLPSGRRMIYSAVRGQRTVEPDPETGKPRMVDQWTADVGGSREKFYGGKLAENATQAIARDVVMEAMLKAQDNGFNVLWSVYDELVTEADPGTDPKKLANIMSETPEWLPGCPLSAESKVLERYCK